MSMHATGRVAVNGFYKFRLRRSGKVIDGGIVKNVITNEARAAMARAYFDGESFPTSWKVGLIGYLHNAFGAPKDFTTDPLGPPYDSITPIVDDINPVSGLNFTASAEASDLGGTTLPTILGTQTWVRSAAALGAGNKATVPASGFTTFAIGSDAACYGFYIISSDDAILLSVANFSWVKNRIHLTLPGAGGNTKWLAGQGPLIADDTLDVAYSIGINV